MEKMETAHGRFESFDQREEQLRELLKDPKMQIVARNILAEIDASGAVLSSREKLESEAKMNQILQEFGIDYHFGEPSRVSIGSEKTFGVYDKGDFVGDISLQGGFSDDNLRETLRVFFSTDKK